MSTPNQKSSCCNRSVKESREGYYCGGVNGCGEYCTLAPSVEEEKKYRCKSGCGCDYEGSISFHDGQQCIWEEVSSPSKKTEPMEKENWTEQYPLNTFYGETKRELISFILSLLSQARQEGYDQECLRYREGYDFGRKEGLEEHIRLLEEMYSNGMEDRDSGWNSALRKAIEKIKSNTKK